jgi:hypothetical protein
MAGHDIEMCTMENPNARTLCQVCQSARPRPSSSQPKRSTTPSAPVTTGGAAAAQWKCHSCTYV